ncbi:hypothetical protein K432DRAFT_384051 [Lepidopterella palustris CBS 459.81]|uniref:Uncharacterized protein n=1 Tax=Lepidopterella palustris CBS 459.81 TaxID=1314670 RepID=A0A8E2JDN7_9PEZI|nr:hypothetical protein K432DRAFT_384051 [Lepidopterella palustris CBS 459.81]
MSTIPLKPSHYPPFPSPSSQKPNPSYHQQPSVYLYSASRCHSYYRSHCQYSTPRPPKQHPQEATSPLPQAYPAISPPLPASLPL